MAFSTREPRATSSPATRSGTVVVFRSSPNYFFDCALAGLAGCSKVSFVRGSWRSVG